MEATHPQILGGVGDSNTKYDVFGNFSRTISPQAVPSPHLEGMPAFNTPEGMSLCGKLRHPLGGAIYERCADGYVHVTTAGRGNWGQVLILGGTGVRS